MGSAGRELLDLDSATSSASVSVGGRASWSAAWSTHTGVNSQQHDDADRLAAAAEEVEAGPSVSEDFLVRL
jgi:hypothetical protein